MSDRDSSILQSSETPLSPRHHNQFIFHNMTPPHPSQCTIIPEENPPCTPSTPHHKFISYSQETYQNFSFFWEPFFRTLLLPLTLLTPQNEMLSSGLETSRNLSSSQELSSRTPLLPRSHNLSASSSTCTVPEKNPPLTLSTPQYKSYPSSSKTFHELSLFHETSPGTPPLAIPSKRQRQPNLQKKPLCEGQR